MCLDPEVWLRCRRNVKETWRNVGWGRGRGRGEGGGVKGKNGAACNAVASRYKNQNKLQRLGSIVNFILLYLELYCFLSTINVSINERKLYVNRMTPSKFNLLVFVHSWWTVEWMETLDRMHKNLRRRSSDACPHVHSTQSRVWGKRLRRSYRRD